MTKGMKIALAATVVALSLSVTGAGSAATYHGFVGPGSSIRLLTGSGVRVARVPAGRHRFLIHDNSRAHNFVLKRGRTTLRRTTLAFKGQRTWTVRILKARHVYLCSSHPRTMRGGFRGV